MSQDEESVSEVDTFCSNQECRDPVVSVEEDGFACKMCGEVFCQFCIEFLAEKLELEYYLQDEDGFCPDCAPIRRDQLDPDTEEGQAAIMENKAIREEHRRLMKSSHKTRRFRTGATPGKYSEKPYTKK